MVVRTTYRNSTRSAPPIESYAVRNPRNAGISAILWFSRDLTDLTDLRLPAVGLAETGTVGQNADTR